MSDSTKPTVVLVHGAYADSSSWNGVIQILLDSGYPVNAVANPCRSVTTDSRYVSDVLASIAGPIVLVGHSYGGMLISQAAIGNSSVKALVYVDAVAPESGETVVQLAGQFPGSTLGETLFSYPLSGGGAETIIAVSKYHEQFVADASGDVAAQMAAGQRPVTDVALNEPASSETQAWKTIPTWFVFGSKDKNIPPAAHHFMAERANAKDVVEVQGGSHALGVVHPQEVAGVILAAAASTSLITAG